MELPPGVFPLNTPYLIERGGELPEGSRDIGEYNRGKRLVSEADYPDPYPGYMFLRTPGLWSGDIDRVRYEVEKTPRGLREFFRLISEQYPEWDGRGAPPYQLSGPYSDGSCILYVPSGEEGYWIGRRGVVVRELEKSINLGRIKVVGRKPSR